jgi:hypothetical protein
MLVMDVVVAGNIGDNGLGPRRTKSRPGSRALPHRTGRAEGALPGRAEPVGIPATERRDPKHRLEQAIQAFTIYFEGRIPTP